MPITRGQAASGVKPGKIETFAYNDTDPAWFDCDGEAKNVVDEPALFAAIGYTHGGAGAVFNLPNLNDDFVRGAHAGRPVGTREGQSIQDHAHLIPVGSSEGDDATLTNGGGQDGNLWTNGSGAGETRPRNVAMKFRIHR